MRTSTGMNPGFWNNVAALFRFGRREGPLDSIDLVNDFAATRSAFVAQKKLYGYLRTRMGTRYVSMFTDDVFVESINVAKMHVYAASLSDLTVFCMARALDGSGLSQEEKARLAGECYRLGIAANAGMVREDADREGWLAAFDERSASIHWENAAATGEVFDASPAALLRWAPIAPELKKFDAEIVRNSIKFAWIEVRAAFDKRIDRESVQRRLPAGAE